ncbi:hypothetical protein [Phormidesmis priestleyi]
MNVASGAVTPWNPGDSSEIRTKQVIAKHRNFTKKEADQLRLEAATRQRQAKNNRQAYKSLRTIERADGSDQATFRGYQTTVATVTAAKKGSDVGKAKVLNGLTPKYANMGYSLGASHEEAQVKVREYQAMYTEVSNRWS